MKKQALTTVLVLTAGAANAHPGHFDTTIHAPRADVALAALAIVGAAALIMRRVFGRGA